MARKSGDREVLRFASTPRTKNASLRPRPALLAAVLVVGVACALAGCGSDDETSPSERDQAVRRAQVAYATAEAKHIDLSDGPCIAERLPGLPDWVVDIAHDPREPVDDVAANQCARYRAGEANHFVEMDENGELIRAD